MRHLVLLALVFTLLGGAAAEAGREDLVAIQEWGMNMVRWARRANETSTWAPVPRQFSHYNVAYAGTLVGIANAQPGRNLQLKPFATARVGPGARGSRNWSGDGGIDVKWGITSSLLLDASPDAAGARASVC